MSTTASTGNVSPINAVSNGQKFLLLLEKNWIIQKRHYLQTLFEIIIPVLCCSILLIVRGPVETYLDATIFEPLSTDSINIHWSMYGVN